jgi:carbon monoxide dehydrogenase subunit G
VRAVVHALAPALGHPNPLKKTKGAPLMARYTGTVESVHPPEAVWNYLADLRSVAEWDPSIQRVELIAGEPRNEGAAYALEVGFLGRTTELAYRIAETQPPNRVVFRAATGSVTVRDEARIEPTDAGGSRVTWDADLQLRGARRVLDLPLRLAFGRLGRAAERGLAEELNRPELVASARRAA